ncbi:ATP-binding cassette domain-containing protein [Gordonia sp. TBRC 11910]|uniref:ATP-binding cassette domain-containing protein n=1 Tax=Gordonia asplenii TaxID=2725283 RepID=A0A848KYI1_9ACTN|nr:ATP-binding cassette domain-containing protein [Gordonia asplenii]NMO03292.1 ATP-binding cassette domain-containing protein [Gordonia asplenii]
MIEVDHLCKRYGKSLAVDDVTFTVRPGMITGFLGPNGAGKSTTMRMILGLDQPTSGTVLINGRRLRDSPAPMAEIGALLDARAVDKGRSARNHLRQLGALIGVDDRRVDDVLATVGLSDVADQAAGSFSLGMGQRLGIAAALLADPAVVLLDEPVNGLDPDGIRWLRTFLRTLADDGRAVFLSSHLMSEMELTADHLIIIGRGRLLADVAMTDFIDQASTGHVEVSTPRANLLAEVLAADDVTITKIDDVTLGVVGRPAAAIGAISLAHNIVLHSLTARQPSLEEAYMALTGDAAEHRARPTVLENAA